MQDRGDLMDTVSVNAAAESSANAVAGARDATRVFLGALGQQEIAPEDADSVILVLSELVTNVLRHCGGTCTLRLTAHPDTIEVAVDDTSPREPRMRTQTGEEPERLSPQPLSGRVAFRVLAHTCTAPVAQGGAVHAPVRAQLPGGPSPRA
jgi:anti-sigma regulatory factor (Ser/Thr protein kinase)